MGDKSPKNNAKAKKQKGTKQKSDAAAKVAASEAKSIKSPSKN